MPKYDLRISRHMSFNVIVEAEDEDAARDKYDNFDLEDQDIDWDDAMINSDVHSDDIVSVREIPEDVLQDQSIFDNADPD